MTRVIVYSTALVAFVAGTSHISAPRQDHSNITMANDLDTKPPR